MYLSKWEIEIEELSHRQLEVQKAFNVLYKFGFSKVESKNIYFYK